MSEVVYNEGFTTLGEVVCVAAETPPAGEVATTPRRPDRTAADLSAAAYRVAVTITRSPDPAEAAELFEALLKAELAEIQRCQAAYGGAPPAGAA